MQHKLIRNDTKTTTKTTQATRTTASQLAAVPRTTLTAHYAGHNNKKLLQQMRVTARGAVTTAIRDRNLIQVPLVVVE